MSNQASADLENAPLYDGGQADAGQDHGGDWEGRASDPSSANTDQHAEYADEPSSAGSGREARADEQDDITSNVTALEDYWATVDKLDLDNMPLDVEETAPTEEEEPVATEQEEEEEPEEAPGKAPQFRLRPKSDLESRTFALMKADPGLDLEAAMGLARASLGLAAPAAEPSDVSDPSDPSDGTTETVADIETQIREQRLAVIAATEAYDLDQVAAAQRALIDLEGRLPEARQREAEQIRAAEDRENSWKDEASATWTAAAKDYPDLNDLDSPFAQRVVEIDEAWEDAGDPRWAKADKARLIANIVAKELGVKPAGSVTPTNPPLKGRTLPAPASSRPSAPATRPGPTAVRPASGSARTAADTPSALEAALSKAETLEDYEALVASHF
jgi:hypothetical protein